MRSVIFLLCCVFSLPLSSQITEEGLIGYWSFDGDYEDHSANDNHGIPDGTILVKDRFGYDQSAVEFDGLDDFITVPHHWSYSLDAYSDDFTISLWYWTLDATTLTSAARFIDKWNANSAHVYSHNLVILEDEIKSSLYDGNLSSQPYAPLQIGGRWTNLIVINDIQSDVSKIYSNGVLEDEVENTSQIPTNNTYDMLFGNDKTKIRAYNGKMDEIRMYDRILSQEEIDEIVNETVVSIEDVNKKLNFTIFPNPFVSKIFLQGEASVISAEIFNSEGVLVKFSSENELDLTSLPVGTYFARITAEHSMIVKKIVKCQNAKS